MKKHVYTKEFERWSKMKVFIDECVKGENGQEYWRIPEHMVEIDDLTVTVKMRSSRYRWYREQVLLEHGFDHEYKQVD